MILVDTAIWIDYLARGDELMATLVEADRVVIHPFVIGEIALGNLKPRAATLAELNALPAVPLAEPDEVIGLIERHWLFGTGIGYVDAHLLASTLLAPGTRLWTRDKRLGAAAERLDIAARQIS